MFPRLMTLCVVAVSAHPAVAQHPSIAPPAISETPSTKQDDTPSIEPRLVVQLGHSNIVTCGSVSPNGKWVITGGSDNSAILWDLATGRELRRFTDDEVISSVAFSPIGSQLLTGSWGGTAQIWEVATGMKLCPFEHSDLVSSVDFSLDGKNVLTGSWDDTARIWDAASCKQLRVFKHSDNVNSVAFSADGEHVLTGGDDDTAYLWDVAGEADKPVRQFHTLGWHITAVAISPDGTHVLTVSGDAVRLWDVATETVLHRIPHCRSSTGDGAIAFSPDGNQAIVKSDGCASILWNVLTDNSINQFGHQEEMSFVAFSRDGQQMLAGGSDDRPFTGGEQSVVRLWDVATSTELRRFRGEAAGILSVAFSSDGTRIVTGGEQSVLSIWDGTMGKKLGRFQFPGVPGFVMSVTLSQNGEEANVVVLEPAESEDEYSSHSVWNVTTAPPLYHFKNYGYGALPVFSLEGKRMLSVSDHEVVLRDVASEKEQCVLDEYLEDVRSLALAPGGRMALACTKYGTAVLWDAESCEELLRFNLPSAPNSVALSRGGKLVLAGFGAEWPSEDNSAVLWDLSDTTQPAEKLCEFTGQGVVSVAFSHDGKRVLTGSFDHTARMYDVATCHRLRAFSGHSGYVTSVVFSPNEMQVLTGSADGTTRIWDVATGEELCQLLTFRDGGWAVVDKNGRYDASDPINIKGLHWVVDWGDGPEVVALSQLKDRYYEPHLLAKILHPEENEPLRDVHSFANPKPTPGIEILNVDDEHQRMRVRLTNRGGGVGRVTVSVNGVDSDAQTRGTQIDPKAAVQEITIDLTNNPRLSPGQANKIAVRVFNGENYIESRSALSNMTPIGPVDSDPPELWAVIAGVSDYRGNELDLQYAAKDAEAFATALRLGANRLFGADRVHMTLLTSPGTDTPSPTGETTSPRTGPATRENIIRALTEAQQARHGDILVVYLSGHGETFGGTSGDFYYLTADAQTADLHDPEIRARTAISSRGWQYGDDSDMNTAGLTELIYQVPAEKKVLVLDTCASGSFAREMGRARQVSSSQIRALERLKDRTGFHILAGSAADAASYEASRYAQGLLTYSLLFGMKGAALRAEQFVDVSTLFRKAEDQVPQLARDIGKRQTPKYYPARGAASFDIGELNDEDKKHIPLQQALPVFVRASFQESARKRDTLHLAKKVNERLNNDSSRGTDAGFVFAASTNAGDMPGAVELSGVYIVKDDMVTVSVVLFDGKSEMSFDVIGRKTDLETLAARIVDDAAARAQP